MFRSMRRIHVGEICDLEGRALGSGVLSASWMPSQLTECTHITLRKYMLHWILPLQASESWPIRRKMASRSRGDKLQTQGLHKAHFIKVRESKHLRCHLPTNILHRWAKSLVFFCFPLKTFVSDRPHQGLFLICAFVYHSASPWFCFSDEVNSNSFYDKYDLRRSLNMMYTKWSILWPWK